MSKSKLEAVLIDLPTFPKGVVSLSLPNVAASLSVKFDVRIVDLNFYSPEEFKGNIPWEGIALYGLKVSSQSIDYAKQVSGFIKKQNPNAVILWGGELPTLLPEECAQHADVTVSGLFEPIAEELLNDFDNKSLKKNYYGGNEGDLSLLKPPRFDLLNHAKDYYSFMGLPLETSRGCTEKCIFCMVHVMQKKHYHLRADEALEKIAPLYTGEFVNIVDYNFGVSKEHVIQTCSILKKHRVSGWMAEMCIEELDDDEMLDAMAQSGCRMIYCGLETIDEQALASVHKMNTNHTDRYEVIIRKVQSHGIQIAAGIIVGLDKMNESTFERLDRYFTKWGVIYAKLTYLTYNPGAKVQQYMKKKGDFTTTEIRKFDGNRLTYIPTGLNVPSINKGTEKFIKNFYSLSSIIHRSLQAKMNFLSRIEFICFNICYRETYIQWLDADTINSPENLRKLIEKPFQKRLLIRFAEFILSLARRLNSR